MPRIASGAKKAVYSFRADEEKVIQWRAYASAKSGITAEDIITKAIENYIEEHPLNEQEQLVFDLEVKKQKMLRG